MKPILLALALTACTKPAAPPVANRVIDVLATVAPTLSCTPEPRTGGLDVALCREGKTVLLCTGGGLSPVECGPAVKLAPPEPKPPEAAP
jgi:hypothetical protein